MVLNNYEENKETGNLDMNNFKKYDELIKEQQEIINELKSMKRLNYESELEKERLLKKAYETIRKINNKKGLYL